MNKKDKSILNIIVILSLCYLLITGSMQAFIYSYMITFLYLVGLIFKKVISKWNKFLSLMLYTAILIIQITVAANILFNADTWTPVAWVERLFLIVLVFAPLFLEKYIKFNENIDGGPKVSFNNLYLNHQLITQDIGKVGNFQKKVNSNNLKTLTENMKSTNSFDYINKNSLDTEYFKAVESTLNDPHLYIIVSYTGTPANDMISLFTKKEYNHASLSFDPELKTIVSFNSGDELHKPGLNQETIEFLQRSENARILIYSIECTREQKRDLKNNIKNINEEGSSYNLVGLLTRHSFRPNIMFCSQFVVQMLRDINLDYLPETKDYFRPTDLIELDYYRKLKPVDEITLES
ncbi:hypothetical protein LQF63_09350 [Tetragenococcus koreensis]|uniref:hypothetical protein n=1 Tax=Tetragenococcus koreensis TaxID=290335 RepID=UPI001F3DADCB|nr:hypothetical protein [Tetragenococcus koreensis]MCF1617838.1 hypothetical protein [Tetragenococcus koreensis]